MGKTLSLSVIFGWFWHVTCAKCPLVLVAYPRVVVCLVIWIIMELPEFIFLVKYDEILCYPCQGCKKILSEYCEELPPFDTSSSKLARYVSRLHWYSHYNFSAVGGMFVNIAKWQYFTNPFHTIIIYLSTFNFHLIMGTCIKYKHVIVICEFLPHQRQAWSFEF